MKKIIRIMLVACFLYQSPVLIAVESGQDSRSDGSGWVLGGIAIFALALAGFNYLKSYFTGETTQITTNKRAPKVLTVKTKGIFEGEKLLYRTGKMPSVKAHESITPGEKPVGFTNPASDCYLNSLLTILLYNKNFADFLLTYKKEIYRLFESDVYISKLEKSCKTSILLYVKQLTSSAGTTTDDRPEEILLEKAKRVWDETERWLCENSSNKTYNQSALELVLQKCLIVEMLNIARQIHEEPTKKPLIQNNVKRCLHALLPQLKEGMQDPSEAASAVFYALELIKDNKNIPVVKKIFGFDYCEGFKCLNCQRDWEKKRSHSYVQLLSLPGSESSKTIPLKKLFDISGIGVNKGEIDEYFDIFCKNSCSNKSNVHIAVNHLAKTYDEMPQMFFLRLARESYQVESKNKTPIEIPELLDMSDYLIDTNKKTQKYQLAGVICHKGDSSDSGHYVDYIKVDSGRSHKWYKFDDDNVTEIKKAMLSKIINPETKKSTRYTTVMALYQKVTT